jgi:hypothetical protein
LRGGIARGVISGDGIGLREEGTIGAYNVYNHNLVFSNGTNFMFLTGSCVGCLSVNPQFVNYQANGTGDYHLASGSPAINAGVTGASTSTGCVTGGIIPCVPSTDFDGISRPQGAAYDIGAYEWH